MTPGGVAGETSASASLTTDLSDMLTYTVYVSISQYGSVVVASLRHSAARHSFNRGGVHRCW